MRWQLPIPTSRRTSRFRSRDPYRQGITPRGTVERVTTRDSNGHHHSVLDEPGGPLGAYVFAPDDRWPASLLVTLLRCATGSLCYDGRYEFCLDRGGWRSMRECSAELLLNAVRRTERA